jgi:hypothetical protein
MSVRVPSLLAVLPLLAAAVAAMPARAVEPYVATGLPYALVGIAQPLGNTFAVRADFGTIGGHAYSGSTSDNDFRGKLHYDRIALVGDWFAFGGGFRLTGGLTLNQAKATMRASSHDGKITIGGVDYDAPSSLYYVQSDLSFPHAMPYLGIGWGHHADATPGFAFNVDLGAGIGKARATPLAPSPALASEIALTSGGAADLASENRQFQDEVGKFKAIPQATLGIGYRF